MPNFIVHGRLAARTDVDVLAVRFRHSCEARFADDNEQLHIPDTPVDVVFAEVKEGCVNSLNGPWANREQGALDYVLKRVGIVPAEHVQHVAKELYSSRKASCDRFTVRICAFGGSVSGDLLSQGVTFVDWTRVFNFIHNRFHDNSEFKRDNDVWDEYGKYLWQNVESLPPTNCKKFFQDWDARKR
jgi:hypothetical protein